MGGKIRNSVSKMLSLKCLLEMLSKELHIQICISIERAGLEIFYILYIIYFMFYIHSLVDTISSRETR